MPSLPQLVRHTFLRNHSPLHTFPSYLLYALRFELAIRTLGSDDVILIGGRWLSTGDDIYLQRRFLRLVLQPSASTS